MKVLIITSEPQIDVSMFDADIQFIFWNNINFRININFSDYDGLIIDADSLIEMREKEEIFLSNFEQQLSPKIIIDILKQKDSFISIIGDPSIILQYHRLSELLGYDILTRKTLGTNITYRCDSGKFKNYWKQIINYHYYFELIKLHASNKTVQKECIINTYDEIKNRSGYILGACLDIRDSYSNLPVFQGEMSFIPPLEKDKKETILNILRTYLSFGNSNEPKWAKSIVVTGQKTLDEKIEKLQEKINKTLQKQQKLEKDKQNLRKSLEVLYKSDKPLEISVKSLLERIGFTNEEPKEQNKVEFCTKYDNFGFVVEIKSTKKESFDMKGLRQVVNWQMDKISESGEKYKPLFVTSNQYNLVPKERNEDILPPNLIKFVEQFEICVLPVTILFCVSQLIEEKKYTTKEFAQLLSKTNGIVKIQEHIS